MRERPIIFSAKSIQAILDGRKTQTRRVMNPQVKLVRSSTYTHGGKQCPYGCRGDALWVREPWMPWIDYSGGLLDCIKFSDGVMFKPENLDEETGFKFDHWCEDSTARGGVWRSPIFMPRWAARMTLRITAVWVQRLNDITRAECQAEGVDATFQGKDVSGIQHEFAACWDKLNARRGFSWAKDPWVWVVEFEHGNGS